MCCKIYSTTESTESTKMPFPLRGTGMFVGEGKSISAFFASLRGKEEKRNRLPRGDAKTAEGNRTTDGHGCEK